MQQENDRLRARRFQLELERGDRLQRIVDLEAENYTLEENADAYENTQDVAIQSVVPSTSRCPRGAENTQDVAIQSDLRQKK
jgi:hypothetical protein